MHKIIKLTALTIFLLAACTVSNGFAQEKDNKPQSTQRDIERRKMHARDELLRSFNKSDTSISNLLQRVEQYTTTFNQINSSLAEGLDTADVSQNSPPVLRRINKIDTLINAQKSSTLRYLFVLRDNLDHIQATLEDWQSGLEDVSAKLIQNQTQLLKFSKDTSLKFAPSDSALRNSFFAQRRSVMQLFRKTDSANRSNLFKVNLLQDKLSIAYTKVLDETDHIDLTIRRFAMKAVAGESDAIWNTSVQYDEFKSALGRTIKLNKILFNYFLKNEAFTHLIGLAFFISFFSWIIYIRRKTLSDHENQQVILDQANYITKKPVLAALLVGAAIIPYFYDHPPVIFLETLFLLSMILSLVFVKKAFPVCCYTFLLKLFALAVFYGVSNLFVQIATIDRYVILALSICAIVIGITFLKQARKSPDDHPPYTILALKIFIAMHSLSLLLNITGRFSLAKIIGVTAVFNLWFLVILYFTVQIIVQGLFLQFKVKRSESSFMNWLDYNILQKKFRNILITIAALLWLFFLMQNLNIDDWISDNVSELLSQSRSVGGASFTFGGFVIFIAVIWLSSVASRIISYFYEVSALRVTDLSVAKKKNRTSSLLIRLGVFSIGFLLAVAASGFPLEKLTIIISAFGIGIGFGLQNIVNNLVSGLILAFEKPIQIGDIIEVDNRSGTMKEIGIRSSKILTSDGSEVIIPNGDLISHHVVNWTLSNSNRRVELLVTVTYGTEIDKVKTLLKDLLTAMPDIMKTPGPSVFLNNVSETAVEFRIFFWADDLNTTLDLRSKVLANINEAFVKEGISLPSSQKNLYLHFPEGVPVLSPGAKAADDKDAKADKEVNDKNAPGQVQ